MIEIEMDLMFANLWFRVFVKPSRKPESPSKQSVLFQTSSSDFSSFHVLPKSN